LIDSHNKFDVLHTLISLVEKLSGSNDVAVHFREVEYTTAVVSMNKMCEKPLQSATGPSANVPVAASPPFDRDVP
jgi:hypothetical protein